MDVTNIKEDYVIKNLYREAKIMLQLKHPCIVSLFETMQCSDQTYYLVTEFVAGGDLCSFVKKQESGKLDEGTTKFFGQQFTSAIAYMHSMGIVHRDLKMENVILNSIQNQIKIVDFGLSNVWTSDCPLKTHCGSPEYAAPELFITSRVYGPEVDLWSLGIILYGMIVGQLPFVSNRNEHVSSQERRKSLVAQINKGIAAPQRRAISSCTSEYRNMMNRLLLADSSKRIRIEELLIHPWITDNGKKYVQTNPLRKVAQNLNNKMINDVSTLYNCSVGEITRRIEEEPLGKVSAVYNILMYSNSIKLFNPENITKKYPSAYHVATAAKQISSKPRISSATGTRTIENPSRSNRPLTAVEYFNRDRHMDKDSLFELAEKPRQKSSHPEPSRYQDVTIEPNVKKSTDSDKSGKATKTKRSTVSKDLGINKLTKNITDTIKEIYIATTSKGEAIFRRTPSTTKTTNVVIRDKEIKKLAKTTAEAVKETYSAIKNLVHNFHENEQPSVLEARKTYAAAKRELSQVPENPPPPSQNSTQVGKVTAAPIEYIAPPIRPQSSTKKPTKNYIKANIENIKGKFVPPKTSPEKEPGRRAVTPGPQKQTQTPFIKVRPKSVQVQRNYAKIRRIPERPASSSATKKPPTTEANRWRNTMEPIEQLPAKPSLNKFKTKPEPIPIVIKTRDNELCVVGKRGVADALFVTKTDKNARSDMITSKCVVFKRCIERPPVVRERVSSGQEKSRSKSEPNTTKKRPVTAVNQPRPSSPMNKVRSRLVTATETNSASKATYSSVNTNKTYRAHQFGPGNATQTVFERPCTQGDRPHKRKTSYIGGQSVNMTKGGKLDVIKSAIKSKRPSSVLQGKPIAKSIADYMGCNGLQRNHGRCYGDYFGTNYSTVNC